MGFVDSFNVYVIITLLYVISIINVYKDKQRRIYIYLAFAVSYFLFYILCASEFISVFLFADVLWFFTLLLGLIGIPLATNNFFYYYEYEKILHKRVKIDVSIPLIFLTLGLSFVLILRSLISEDIFLIGSYLSYLKKINTFQFYINLFIYLLVNTLNIFIYLLFFVFLTEKLNKKFSNIKISAVVMFLSSLLFVIFGCFN